MKTIDFEEWFAELAVLQESEADGFLSTSELSRAAGRSRKWILERLHEAKQQGRLVIKRRDIFGIDGKRKQICVFKVLPPKRPAKRQV